MLNGHGLSLYTPICSQCGLVLCELQPPSRACPHCAAALLTPSERLALLTRLEELRAQTLEEEAVERGRVAEAARLAEGAFPVLARGGAARGLSQPTEATHRVISLTASTGVVKFKSYATPPIPLSDPVEIVTPRVPAPPGEIEYMRVPRQSATRWTDLRGEPVQYTPPPSAIEPGRGAKQGRGKGRGVSGANG
ncbi:hypothetical protein BC834DRAFT_906584 [Gloeopeniophorella convolvens]|nr:hypothetical protein BC834DRAFT_906584 [Gloeopeniophorella convolvens]